MALLEQNISLWGEDIPWLAALREKGRTAFGHSGLPHRRTEAWKYSFFAEEELQNPQIDITPHHCDGECEHHKKSPFGGVEVHVCNGRVIDEEFAAAEGLVIKSLVEAIFDGDVQKYLGKSFAMEDFPFAALNSACLEQGVFILCERGFSPQVPLYLHYHQHAGFNRFCNVRNVIVVENNAKLTLVEDFTAEDGAQYLHNQVNEIFVGRGACCNHYIRQSSVTGARHIRLNSVQVKEQGEYYSFYAGQECALTRQESFIRLLSAGAKAKVDGIYQIKHNGVSDITTNIRHLAAETTSEQTIKGVVDGCGKGIFQGQIHIAPDAQQTVGKQLHKALLLSDAGEVDCKPELEIYADDVQCSHGATCGDLDAEQLFYLQSRGIDEAKSRQILINAYFDEMLLSIDEIQIRQWISELFSDR